MTKYRPGKAYPKNWNALRWAIFREHGYKCGMCQKYSRGNLHLHHILPLGMGGSNAKSNLIPLCKDCHEYVHFELRKRKIYDIRNLLKRS